MAICETCMNPVLVDGRRCDRCQLVGRERDLPRGFVAYGWHSYSGAGLSALAKLTVAHLIPDAQVRLVKGGTVAVADGPALCGARPSSRKAERDHPSIVAGEARRGERKWCVRCFVRVAEAEHVPKYRTSRTGVGNRYGRGASGSGGRNTHVECACGWTNRSNVTKREQEKNFREHLLGVVEEGLFRIEEEGFEPRIDSLSAAAARLDPYGREGMRDALAGLVMGESMGGPGGSRSHPRYVKVHRTRVPMVPKGRS